jgi:carboxypeptidase C (cathepsin A)
MELSPAQRLYGPISPRAPRRACLLASLLTGGLCLLALAPSWAADAPGSAPVNTPPVPVKTPEADAIEPFPPPKSIRQSAIIAGKTVEYVLTIGSFALKDPKGKVTGEVVYAAYTVPGRSATSRPVTFSVNGGPGAASAYLNLGVLGPKHIGFGQPGDYASNSPGLSDNPNSWLDFTDLVFIDPIGTGYSRSRVDEEETKKDFLNADADVHYLAEVMTKWLTQNNRQLSPKYLIGESYGGYRVPRLAEYMQTDMGVGVSGITLVSPFLDPPATINQDALSPLPWVIQLPSMVAGAKERRGEPVTPESMAPVELYVRTAYVTDFLAGQRDEAAANRMSTQVAQWLGLDPKTVRRLVGRVPPEVFIRESRRDEGKISSFYETNSTGFNPFPEREKSEYIDPILGSTAPFAEAMIDIVNNQVGWKVDARYYINNYDVAMKFQRDDKDAPVSDLRKATANDPRMSVLIAHGWNDLACPYFESKLLVAQMPNFGVTERVKVRVYPGGHMFYARPDSAAAFRRDALQSYAVQ